MSLEKVSSFAPLPIRIMVGIAFIIHGLPKFENISGTQGFFGSVGLPPELALPIGLLEIIGGIVIIVGIFTRIASILFIIEMILAILIVKISNGFIGQGGYEVDLLLLAMVSSLLLSGPGRLSIERCIKKRNSSKNQIQIKIN
ncbi:MAG: DoxX family protein [Nitrosopumilus sp.]|nr:DoxX family protein [Nitrosopumilus sp.]